MAGHSVGFKHDRAHAVADSETTVGLPSADTRTVSVRVCQGRCGQPNIRRQVPGNKHGINR